jgi:hypothetical protein
MLYLLVDPANADDLNRGIMRCLRPSNLRDENYVTDVFAKKVVHPQTGYTALELDPVQNVPIHIEADGAELMQVINFFVSDGSVTQQEADGIALALNAMAGQEISVLGFVPPGWLQYVYTKEQMIAEGWFPSEAQG